MKILGLTALMYIALYGIVMHGFGRTDVSSAVVRSQTLGAATALAEEQAVSAPQTSLYLLDDINRQRSVFGFQTLVFDSDLQMTAESRVRDMVSNRYYSHTSPRGDTYVDVLKNSRALSCENLDLTTGLTRQRVIGDWLGSSLGHRECLLSPTVSRIGIAQSVFDVDTDQYITVAIFATSTTNPSR